MRAGATSVANRLAWPATESARLYQRDYQTGAEGISMAGALLFGRDEVVLGVVPHHRTDAIQRDRVVTENSNNPHGLGLLRPDDFAPSPKNPAIARVFHEMRWAEEMGSGVRNLFRYARAFGGQDPILNEESIFRVTVMLPQASQTATSLQPESGAESGAESEQMRPESEQMRPELQPEPLDLRVLRCLQAGPLNKTAISRALGQRSISGPLNQAARQLLVRGLIEYTLPDRPSSRLQQYRLTAAGRTHLNLPD